MLKVDIIVDEEKWLNHINKTYLKKYVIKIFDNLINYLNYDIKNDAVIELCLMLTNDENIRVINNKYRNIDKSTNVLSFPMFENEFPECLNYINHIILGDIMLSLDTILAESDSTNKKFLHHLSHLILHSMLHLLGFDHIEDDDANNMETIEINILNNLAIKNPYI